MWLVRNFRHVYNCDIALASTSQQNTPINPCTIWHAACYNRVNDFNYQLSYNYYYCYYYYYININIIVIVVVVIVIIVFVIIIYFNF